MSGTRVPSNQPVIAALIGGSLAVGVGLWSMQAGGAADLYVLVNGAALGAGVLLAALLLIVPRRAEGALAVAAALALLATGLWGVDIEGIQRWVSLLGIVQLQPAFILLPLLLCMYARWHNDPWHAVAVVIAAAAIMLQPDRSMTLPLVAVAFAVWLADRTAVAATVLAAAVAALFVTFGRDDPLTGVRFVEHVLLAGWRISPMHGLILSAGALAMLAPFLTARRAIAEQQRAIIAFTFCWAMLLIASLIGAYPTPLLGYGASAIIGYFLSLAALRRASPPIPASGSA